MWTTNNRARYDRSFLRYPSDLTDDEWALVEPLIPPAKRGGDKRTVIMREVVNGLMYILSTGCQWRAIPKDLPPRSTIHGYFDLWSWDGTLDRIHHMLYVKCREALGREASPTAAVIDSQSGLRSMGCAWREANVEDTTLEAVIDDLLEGLFSNPVRVIGLNVSEGWVRDVSEEIAEKLRRRWPMKTSTAIFATSLVDQADSS